MGFWSTVVGLGKAGDVVDAGIDLIGKAGDGIDKVFYTDEERAEYAAEIEKGRIEAGKNIIEHAVAMNKMANEGNSIRSITRRYLALTLLGTYTLSFLIALGGVFLGKEGLIEDVQTLVDIYKLGTIAITIVIFYFGYYGLDKIINKPKA